MNHDLFRQESLDANKTKVLGPVALYCPPFRWLIVAMVCALTIVLVGFCSLGSYTKRETAKGVLTPESGIMTITALTSVTVTALPVREQVDKMAAMRAEGYASNTQVEQQESDLLDAKVRLQDVARQRIEIRQQHAQTRQQLREQPLTYFQQKNDLQHKLSDITQSMMENESRRSVDLRAPEEGTVSAVLVKPGQIVSAGQTIAMLLPDNAHLQARILLSSRAIGFIHTGQRVVLRYESFPWQKFGQHSGAVSEISTSPLSPQEIAGITGNTQIQEPLYQVKVTLDSQSVQAYGKQIGLRPGSGLDADFIVDKRRIYEWVLEPLNALGKMTSL